jgi:hypothetical protein
MRECYQRCAECSGGQSVLGAGPPTGLAVSVVNTPLPVSVTNVSTQYPRTPVAFCLGSSNCPGLPQYYPVPSDQRLVIETISFSMGGCQPAAVVSASILAGTVPTVAAGPATLWTSVVNVRVVVDHDQKVAINGGGFMGGGCDVSTQNLWVSGYLVSVNSPSFAP